MASVPRSGAPATERPSNASTPSGRIVVIDHQHAVADVRSSGHRAVGGDAPADAFRGDGAAPGGPATRRTATVAGVTSGTTVSTFPSANDCLTASGPSERLNTATG